MIRGHCHQVQLHAVTLHRGGVLLSLGHSWVLGIVIIMSDYFWYSKIVKYLYYYPLNLGISKMCILYLSIVFVNVVNKCYFGKRYITQLWQRNIIPLAANLCGLKSGRTEYKLVKARINICV